VPNIRLAPLHVALCALLLVGCTTGGPQGAGDLAGRQAPGAVPGDVTATTIISMADRVRATGDLNSAVSFYRRAIAISPNLVPAYIGLGETLLALGYPNEAAEAFRSATSQAQKEQPSPERASHEVAAKRGVGLALIALNQPTTAIEMLNQANAIEPAVSAYSAIGVAEDLLGDSEAAEKAYKQGLALAPNNLDLQNNYGLSQALHGDFNGAVSTLRRVASDSKATARHRLNLALALGLAGRAEDAAQVARIDLDERSVRSNLSYYAELRALPTNARAMAILRPGTPLHADGVLANCEGSSCPKPELPGEKLSAVPTAPVDAKLLPTQPAKPAPLSSPAAAKPTPLTPPTATKPAVAPVDPTEKKVSKPAKSSDTTAKAQSTEPAHAVEAVKPATVASTEPPAQAPAPSPTTQADSEPPKPVVDATPATLDETKPAAKAEETKPAIAAPSTEAAADAIAQPPTKADEPKPAPVVADTVPTPMADNPVIAVQDEAKPVQALAPSSPNVAIEDHKPTEQADAAKPEVDNSKPATAADTTLAAADGDPVLGAMPAPQAPANASLPTSPVVKAAAFIPPLPPGKHAWIQIASFRSEQNAQSAWKTMTTGNQDLLRYVPLSVRRVDLGSDKGTYYVLRIGPLASMDQAHDLCAALKDRQITCVVAK
jgi:Flp pilus assembly protein TadD